MEETNKELPNFISSFEDDFVLRAAKVTNRVVRTLGSISNKRCFCAQIGTTIQQTATIIIII